MKGEGLHVELQAEAVQSGTSVVCHWPSLPSSSQMASPQLAVRCLLDSPSGLEPGNGEICLYLGLAALMSRKREWG